MKKIIYIFFGIAATIVCISSTSKVQSPCDSPVVGDHSGAPGETNCSGCHSAPVNPDIPDLHFEIGNNESTYTPGNTYLVNVAIKRMGHNKFGFVCSSLDTLNTSKGTFTVLSINTTRKYTLGGRNYFSHTPCGADAQDSIQWTFNWTAPATNKGEIKFYMSMLVANHDEALTGDTTYTRVISLLPSAVNGIGEISAEQKAKVFPNFFDKEINIEFNEAFNNGPKRIQLLNLNGQVIRTVTTTEPLFSFSNLETLNDGLYFLKINYSQTSETIKIIKP